jgi:hypothetical protein
MRRKPRIPAVTKRLLPAGRFGPERPAKPPAEPSIKGV